MSNIRTTVTRMMAAMLLAGAPATARATQADGPAAAGTEPLFVDARLGTQMTVAEIRRDLVGNSLVWSGRGGRNFQYLAPDGTLRGGSEAGASYAIHWHFRAYDNLLCVDSGDSASSGCVQLLRRGQEVSFRRKDGVVELTAVISAGEAEPMKR